MNTLIRLLIACLVLFAIDAAAKPFRDGYEGEPPKKCNIPPGFTVVTMPWESLFGKPFPNSTSWLQPIGSFTLRDRFNKQGRPIAGKIITTAFVMDNRPHKIDWVTAQPIGSVGYGVAQIADSVTVGVSECPADLFAKCKTTASSSRVNFGPGVAGACNFKPGTTLYATIHYTPANLNPKQNTCRIDNPSGGTKCDSNFGAK